MYLVNNERECVSSLARGFCERLSGHPPSRAEEI